MNIFYKLILILFCICLISHSTLVGRTVIPLFEITLNLGQPEYGSCGNISINGFVGTSSGTITRLSWDWGDGTVVDSFFVASHRYQKMTPIR